MSLAQFVHGIEQIGMVGKLYAAFYFACFAKP